MHPVIAPLAVMAVLIVLSHSCPPHGIVSYALLKRPRFNCTTSQLTVLGGNSYAAGSAHFSILGLERTGSESINSPFVGNHHIMKYEKYFIQKQRLLCVIDHCLCIQRRRNSLKHAHRTVGFVLHNITMFWGKTST